MSSRFHRSGRVFRSSNAAPPDDNYIIQSLWIGSTLSTMENLCIRSFLSNGHDFHLYLYGPCEGIPKGAKVLDANEIIRESEIKNDFHHVNSAVFSDMFRYLMLQRRARWWVDMDTICLRHFDFPDPYVFASEVSFDGTGMMVDNGILKAPANSELLRLSSARTNESTFGPGMMTDLTKDLNLRQYVHPPKAFTPIMPWLLPNSVLDPGTKIELEGSYAVHLWNNHWTKEQKNKEHDPGCFYEALKRRYA